MKQLSLLVALAVCFVQYSFAQQVKKQYKDQTFTQTTVVIKNDNANDADILNSMDLDDIGMDQVIQIKTAPAETTPPPASETAVAVVEVPKTTTEQQVESTDRASDASEGERTTVTQAKQSTKTAEAKKSGSGNYRKIDKYPKYKNKRFKKSKRKKHKQGKMKCFRF